MGAGGSNHCFVQLDRIDYNPGDTVCGTLQVSIVNPVVITEVQIKVTGSERTYWREEKTRTEERREQDRDGNESVRQVQVKEYDEHWGHKDFFKVRVPVHRPGQMFSGQYSFPFQIQLPPNLPGSFAFRGQYFKTDFDCRCFYKIKGICMVQGFLKSDIKHTQLLQVIEKPPPIVGQAAQETTNVNVCCCLNRGEFSISMRSDKNAYCASAGEVVQVIAEMDNRTTKDVGNTYVELCRRLVIRDNMGRTYHREHAVLSGTFPGIPHGSSLRDGAARYMPLTLSVPLEPQCLGRLIQCAYYLRVYAYIPCANDPDVRVPICVYAPQPPPQAWQPPPAPAGWNPQVMQTVQIPIPAVQGASSQQEYFQMFQPSAPPPNY